MSVKAYILKIRKEINDVLKSDLRCQEFIEEIEGQGQDIRNTFKQIQSLEEDFPDEKERAEMLMTLNETMEDLNKLNKLTQEDFEEYISGLRQFKIFQKRYPGLFKMFLRGDINNDALSHCLDTFSLFETGAISLEQGKEMGWNKFHKLD